MRRVNVRLIAPPEAMEAALSHLAATHGDGWQLATEHPNDRPGQQVIRYGTLTVPPPPEDRGPETFHPFRTVPF